MFLHRVLRGEAQWGFGKTQKCAPKMNPPHFTQTKGCATVFLAEMMGSKICEGTCIRNKKEKVGLRHDGELNGDVGGGCVSAVGMNRLITQHTDISVCLCRYQTVDRKVANILALNLLGS